MERLFAIQKARRRNHSLLERLDQVGEWVRRRPSAPSPVAERAVKALLGELSRLASHLREEECAGCPSFTTCRSYQAPAEQSCSSEPKPLRASSRVELLRLSGELCAAQGDWPQLLLCFGALEKAMREHIAAREVSFRSSLLAGGHRR